MRRAFFLSIALLVLVPPVAGAAPVSIADPEDASYVTRPTYVIGADGRVRLEQRVVTECA